MNRWTLAPGIDRTEMTTSQATHGGTPLRGLPLLMIRELTTLGPVMAAMQRANLSASDPEGPNWKMTVEKSANPGPTADGNRILRGSAAEAHSVSRL